MARWMNDPDSKLYRVVVENTKGWTTVYGPYEHKRSAGFVRSYMTRGWHASTVKDSWIEVTEPTWTKDE